MAQNPADLGSLRRFDLNLLVAFDILIAERSVTAASKRLGVGQPAMSNALSRLRDMFGDPLLIRAPTGLQPTSRALDLVAPVAHSGRVARGGLQHACVQPCHGSPDLPRRALRPG